MCVCVYRSADELIDVIEGNRIYMPCVYALNKIDAITMEELDVLDAVPHYCPISSHYKWNLDGLMDMVFEYLNMTRIYTKPKGQMPDYSAPVLLRATHTAHYTHTVHLPLGAPLTRRTVWVVTGHPARRGRAYDRALLQEDPPHDAQRLQVRALSLSVYIYISTPC